MAEETKSGSDSEQLKPAEPSTANKTADAATADAAEQRLGEREQNLQTPGRFVVGIGASAGGLEALEELLRDIDEINAALVVVQHLSPHYASALTQLLARNSKVAVVTVADGMALEANRIYVIPPNADLSIFHGTLYLTAPVVGAHFPIDHFFRSLADDQGTYAIGVVLSGTGSDGTFGLTAIKAAGGITFVQEPSSAKYDGMPRSALASGASDFCLTPKEIAAELGRITRHHREKPPGPAADYLRAGHDESSKLFMLIRAQFGNDLTQYKPATLDRRIERRMTMHKIERLGEYVKFAQSHPAELQALYKDMLITVTSFFRDPDAFEALKTDVFPNMLRRRESGEPIRIWSPACASGEEAYSIAICLFEFLEEKAPGIDIQIFGTDIDEDSIQTARRGVYAQNISTDVSAERLNRFFIRKDGDYHISRRIRDAVVFSRQNILKDAPFSRIDLVSCRNLLIYLQPVAQKKVLRVIHYALKPSGFLLLGASETVGDDPELFSLVDRKNKIYSRKAVAASYTGFDVNFGVPAVHEVRYQQPPATRPTVNLQGLADRQVLDLYGPPGVVINHLLDILQFRGHTGVFLDPAPGSASFNILRLVRPAFQIDLKRIIEDAISKQTRVSCETTYHDEGKQHVVRLDVVPLQDPETQGRCFLVLFHKLPAPKEIPVLSAGAQESEVLQPLTQRVRELEGELAITRDYLYRTNQEKESANEQLQAANEELQSANEELQSINEELETSKEEMQSTNEELTTVNEELHNRMAELSQTNDDLHNVLSGIDLSIIIVGLDLRIRRYTAAAENLFHLVPSDIGRPIDIIDPFLEPSKLRVKARSVIETLSTLEEDVLASNQRWYALRISPYQTLDHSIRGALVALSDVDIRKRTTETATDLTAYPRRFLDAIAHPLLIIDSDTRILWANDAFITMFHLVESPVGRVITVLNNKQFGDPGLQDLLHRALSIGTGFRDYRMTFHPDNGEDIVLRIGGSRIPASGDRSLALLSIEIDVTAKAAL